MKERNVAELLRVHGVQPSAQRVAIAEYLLGTDSHPTADRVLQEVRKRLPFVSRATVYNTLNLLTKKGLLGQHLLGAGAIFDANTAPHHHFIDEETGELLDVSGDRLAVTGLDSLEDLEVTSYMVVIRGRKRRGAR
jgi:Fe2+ or Zn2+ uptake regulation protein